MCVCNAFHYSHLSPYLSSLPLLSTTTLPYKFLPHIHVGIFLFETGILLHICNWPRTSYVDQAGPKFTVVHLPLSPYCWGAKSLDVAWNS